MTCDESEPGDHPPAFELVSAVVAPVGRIQIAVACHPRCRDADIDAARSTVSRLEMHGLVSRTDIVKAVLDNESYLAFLDHEEPTWEVFEEAIHFETGQVLIPSGANHELHEYAVVFGADWEFDRPAMAVVDDSGITWVGTFDESIETEDWRSQLS